jgi:hypothetical protein
MKYVYSSGLVLLNAAFLTVSRERFIIVSVYTIRGIDIPYVFYIYYMFRPDVAIFKYTGSYNHLFLFLLLSLHLSYTQYDAEVRYF